MSNIKFIQDNLSKKPFILKSIMKMSDIENINLKYIKHCLSIINKNPHELKTIKIAYNNYQLFMDLYKAILKITGIDSISINFPSLTLDEKENFLNLHNIKFIKNENQDIIIESEDYETTRLIGSEHWCIYKSKNMWNKYNLNRKHIIIATKNNLYGVTFKDNYFQCFDMSDSSISYKTIKNKIPSKYNITRKITNNNTDDISFPLYFMHLFYTFITVSILFECISFFSIDFSIKLSNLYSSMMWFYIFFLLIMIGRGVAPFHDNRVFIKLSKCIIIAVYISNISIVNPNIVNTLGFIVSAQNQFVQKKIQILMQDTKISIEKENLDNKSKIDCDNRKQLSAGSWFYCISQTNKEVQENE
jgi:hypothetical protein